MVREEVPLPGAQTVLAKEDGVRVRARERAEKNDRRLAASTASLLLLPLSTSAFFFFSLMFFH
jgi:hypothetical protein